LGRCDRKVRQVRQIAAVMAVVSLLSGCGLIGSSKVLREAPQVLTVTSPLFTEGTIPSQFTCHGVGESPPIFWSGAPSGTRSFALVVDDSDAPITPYVYWIVLNVSPGTDIQPGMIPPGAVQAENSSGAAKYQAPCPAEEKHQYRFTVYALNATLRLGNGAALKSAWTAIASHAIARGRLTATARPK
jgi:Raf kinase inhibitor-like YbhB/YbcL family protein